MICCQSYQGGISKFKGDFRDMENRIAFNITEAEKEDILKAVQTLKDKLQPLLIALDKRDKQMLAKMSDKSIPFVEKVMQ